ncbi:hypothetical protein [Microbulbifer discodermiae]|uniref:hypothetical protein n=1 Tax=Microbulbifer sp. 2201CG32-9 TaxID=3232309 RepID=UPI00345C35D0
MVVDDTLIQAWASHNSYRYKDDANEPPAGGGGNSETNFHSEKLSNVTRESKTKVMRGWPGRALVKKAKLSYVGHTVMENRNGLIVRAC